MFHVLIQDKMKIDDITTDSDSIYFYRSFPDRNSAFKQGLKYAMDSEEEDFPHWLEESAGVDAKKRYERYLESYKRDLRILSELSSYDTISFEVLNFISPVEIYRKSYIFSLDFSEYTSILKSLIQVPDFINWVTREKNSIREKTSLEDYLLLHQEGEFTNMMNSFIQGQL
jgi:hypothetical protein